MDLERIGPNRWRLARSEHMNVDAVFYMKEEVLREFGETGALNQLADAAALPGVQEPVLGMPDLHQGYGLPIGGVMATAADDEDLSTSVVSAGAVGYDINCGVRLLSTSVEAAALGKEELQELVNAVVRRIPPGVGKSSAHQQLGINLEEIVTQGAAALVHKGYGRSEDLEATEELGAMEGASLSAISKRARGRADQLATLGGGNHFIELQRVDEAYEPAVADSFGLSEGSLAVMIHTGSRGFGHQVCSDYTKLMAKRASSYGIDLPNKGLACVPIGSEEGQDYLAAMACAVNYAFANRQLIAHDVRQAFREVLAGDHGDLGLDMVYDVAHNIAKFEHHDGKRMLVHRKGATRALPSGHPDNPPRYQKTGHPALIPGDMATGSYVVVGTEETRESFHSVNHGAGRIMSRTAAKKQISTEDLYQQLGDVIYGGVSAHKVRDEAPGAYKDIHAVVDTLAEIGLTKKVVRLRPLAVIKGA